MVLFRRPSFFFCKKAGSGELLGHTIPKRGGLKMSENHIYDIIIIGGGPGGYTAALYAARAGLDLIVIEKQYAGGQMALTEQIDNYPGFDDGVDGFYLAEKMKKQAERFGAESKSEEVISVDLKRNPKVIETKTQTYYAKSVVLATGASARKLGLPGEEELLGRGLSYCAACDGMFFRDKTVVVVGGGNSAAGDALLLSRICRKVILIHRGERLQATQIYHAPLMNTENIEIRQNSTVTELLHDNKLSGVRVKDMGSGEEKRIGCEGVFVCVGRKPETELVKGQLDLDANGYIIAGEDTKCNIPGVYAVGDVRTKPLRQVVSAAADGAVCVQMAEEFLAAMV